MHKELEQFIYFKEFFNNCSYNRNGKSFGYEFSYAGELLERYSQVYSEETKFDILKGLSSVVSTRARNLIGNEDQFNTSQLSDFLKKFEKENLTEEFKIYLRIIEKSKKFFDKDEHLSFIEEDDYEFLSELKIKDSESMYAMLSYMRYVQDKGLILKVLNKHSDFYKLVNSEYVYLMPNMYERVFSIVKIAKNKQCKPVIDIVVEEKDWKKSLPKNAFAFLNNFFKIQQNVLKEAEIEKLSSYHFTEKELLQLNYMLLDSDNKETRKEKIAVKFMKASFESKVELTDEEQNFVRNHCGGKFSRKIDGEETFSEWFQYSCHRFYNFDVYKFFLNQVGKPHLTCFLKINVLFPRLPEIRDDYFETIFHNAVAEAKTKEDLEKYLDVYQKRFNVLYFENAKLSKGNQVPLNAILKLEELGIFNYQDLDYKEKNRVTEIFVKKSLELSKEQDALMLIYIYENFGLDSLQLQYTTMFSTDISDKQIDFSAETKKAIYNIKEEYYFYRDFGSFFTFLYNYFKSDIDKWDIYSKEEWKEIITLAVSNLKMNESQIELINNTFLSEEDLEKIRQEKELKKREQEIESFLKNARRRGYSTLIDTVKDERKKIIEYQLKTKIVEIAETLLCEESISRNREDILHVWYLFYRRDMISSKKYFEIIDTIKDMEIKLAIEKEQQRIEAEKQKLAQQEENERKEQSVA